MNPNVKTKWVEALRSGEYTQGRNLLHYMDDFCCLGVLCELAVKDGVQMSVSGNRGVNSYDNNASSLPDAVKDWAGLSSNLPLAKIEGVNYTLHYMNDDGNSFAEIADIIEKGL
jgi:hypothetical protein